MKRLLLIGMLLVLALGVVSPAAAAPASEPGPAGHTYNVLVGYERASIGLEINAYFPDTVHIHVGDTVHWIQNTIEIHTVTFLAGEAMPEFIVPAPAGLPSPIMLNPQVAFPTAPAGGMYDGSTYANSGVLQKGQTFDLTFTQAGTYDYVCVVHGMVMSGKVVVDEARKDGEGISRAEADHATDAPSRAVRKMLDQVQAAEAAARAQAAQLTDTHNADGTTTHHVLMGFGQGQIELMRFFPKNLRARAGDTIEWSFGPGNMAPHTVTFLNGAPGAEDILPYQMPDGSTLLLLNPAIVFPANPGKPLERTGVYSSGLLVPGQGPQTFSLKIGEDMSGVEPYECLLHEESGMVGSVTIMPAR